MSKVQFWSIDFAFGQWSVGEVLAVKVLHALSSVFTIVSLYGKTWLLNLSSVSQNLSLEKHMWDKSVWATILNLNPSEYKQSHGRTQQGSEEHELAHGALNM